MSDQTPHPQVISRGTRTFYDQHRRPFSAIIENRTGKPVHPPTPRFKVADPRFYPPENFVKVGQGDDGSLEIDYPGWHRSLVDAWSAYEARKAALAEEHNKDAPQAALKNPSKFLRRLWGDPPLHPDIPRAMQVGNKYVLGFSDVRPSWLTEDHLPPLERTDILFEGSGLEEFPDAEDDVEEEVEYPVRIPGGRWKLSTQEVVKCSEEEAKEAEARIAELAGV